MIPLRITQLDGLGKYPSFLNLEFQDYKGWEVLKIIQKIILNVVGDRILGSHSIGSIKVLHRPYNTLVDGGTISLGKGSFLDVYSIGVVMANLEFKNKKIPGLVFIATGHSGILTFTDAEAIVRQYYGITKPSPLKIRLNGAKFRRYLGIPAAEWNKINGRIRVSATLKS